MLSPGHPCYSCGFQFTLPVEERRAGFNFAGINNKLFQSTLPARGATDNARAGAYARISHFNPRSPRGERQFTRVIGRV